MSDFGHKPIKGGGYAPAEEAQISTGPSHRECIHSESYASLGTGRGDPPH